MPKQLILLAGLHKTATSSIQQTCAANLQALLEAGFAYPMAQGQSAIKASNHTQVLAWFRKNPSRMGLTGRFTWTERDYGPERAAYLDRMGASFRTIPGNLLMIAESVSIFDPDELLGLKSWFEGNGFPVRLICHVRLLPSWIHSMIAQRVNAGVRLSISQAVDEYVEYGSIVRRRIESLQQVFPQAEFYSHEEAAAHHMGPAGFFFSKVGIASRRPWHEIRSNVGSGDRATRVMSLVNEKFGRFTAAGTVNADWYNDEAFAVALRQLGGASFRLRAPEVAPILPLLHSDNEWLLSALGPRFHEPRMDFGDVRVAWDDEALSRLREILIAVPQPVRAWVIQNRERLDIDAAI